MKRGKVDFEERCLCRMDKIRAIQDQKSQVEAYRTLLNQLIAKKDVAGLEAFVAHMVSVLTRCMLYETHVVCTCLG